MDKAITGYLDECKKLLPVGTSISFTEAEKRAGKFLEALAHITDWKHELGKEKIRLLSIQSAVYAEELFKGTDKTITGNKIAAEASAAYIKAREELEDVENDLAYLKSYYDIFLNGHLFYRVMARGDNT